MKKLVSLLLSLALILSVCSFAAAEDEVVKLTWAMGMEGSAPADNAMVLEALNAISREAIGVEVDIKYFNEDELLLSINSGEVYDMYFTASWFNNFNTAVANGLYANIEPYIKEWTPDLYAIMPEEVWNLAKSSDGGLYAIPVKKDYAPECIIHYPADVAANLGFEIPDVIEKWDELTDFLVAWKATMGENQYPVMLSNTTYGIDYSFDFIDRDALIGVIPGAEEPTKVVCALLDPETVERYNTLYKWYKMGLINPDAATLNESAIATDADHQHIGFDLAWDHYDWSPTTGYYTKMTRYEGPFLNTDGVTGAMNAFSVTLEEDPARFRKALQYQELVNTNKLYRDTLRYGVQGYHWNYVTEGPCAGGVLKTGVGDYEPWAFAQGNYELSGIQVTQEQVDGINPPPYFDQWEVYFEACETAPVSAIAGFGWDSSNVASQIAQINAIKGEYLVQLNTGTGEDPETLIPKFIDALYDAGLQDVIDDAQAQLDAFLAK